MIAATNAVSGDEYRVDSEDLASAACDERISVIGYIGTSTRSGRPVATVRRPEADRGRYHFLKSLKPDRLSRIFRMSPSGAEFIRQIKSQIDEVDPAQVAPSTSGNGDRSLVDVRESDECDAGHIPGAKHVPARLPRVAHRGRRRPTARQHVVLYCASGNRSALAAHTLQRGPRLRATSSR